LPPSYSGYAVTVDQSKPVTAKDDKTKSSVNWGTSAPPVQPAPMAPVVTMQTPRPAAVTVPQTTVVNIPSQSTAEAGVTTFAPVSIATAPDVNALPMAPPTPRIPQAPQPVVQRPTYNYPPQPVRPWSTEPSTSVPGMNNAFTSTPAPELVAQNTNAFGTVDAPAPRPNPVPAMNVRGSYVQGAPGYGIPGSGNAGYAVASNGPSVPPGYRSMNPQPNGQAVTQMMSVLKDSLYPSQREYAAESLTVVDWQTNPQVTQALMTAARDDPAATVRAACARCLGKMHANTAPVVSTLEALKRDTDPRVRQEAGEACTMLAK
jgi:hypothetical protein